jgi:hypothetical protein
MMENLFPSLLLMHNSWNYMKIIKYLISESDGKLVPLTIPDVQFLEKQEAEIVSRQWCYGDYKGLL